MRTNIRTPYTDIERLSAYVELRRYHDYWPVHRYPWMPPSLRPNRHVDAPFLG
jgi:hypothetical protein